MLAGGVDVLDAVGQVTKGAAGLGVVLGIPVVGQFNDGRFIRFGSLYVPGCRQENIVNRPPSLS